MRKAAGQALAQLLKEKGLTQAQAAQLLGVSQAAISQMINGEFKITARMANLIEKRLGGSADAIIHAQAAEELRAAREADATDNGAAKFARPIGESTEPLEPLEAA